MKNRIRQSVCRWCLKDIPLPELAAEAVGMGLAGIDLVDPPDWPKLKERGLICTMTPSHSIEIGLNDPANHESCLGKIRASIESTAAAGFPNIICFSGNRAPGISDRDGLENCARALKQVISLAESKKITIHMELLNSKLDHPGYMCDRSGWGADLVQRVGSPRFKLLYDIYHMQVQEGDVIATIRQHGKSINHYHTAGVPGRNEMDQHQELFYPAIIHAIAQSGFEGFIAHEFIPRYNAIESLRKAVAQCDI